MVGVFIVFAVVLVVVAVVVAVVVVVVVAVVVISVCGGVVVVDMAAVHAIVVVHSHAHLYYRWMSERATQLPVRADADRVVPDNDRPE